MRDSTSTYKAHVKTFDLAKAFTGRGDVSTVADSMKPPYCLRVVKAYRNAEIQAFRDEVAKRMRLIRALR